MFWSNDFTELLKPILIINNSMTNEEKLNTVMRLILFIGLIIILLTNSTKVFILLIILLLISILIYKSENFNKEFYSDYIYGNCVMPTKENPLMNSNIFYKKFYNSCNHNNKKIKNKVSKILDNTINYDSGNIYNKNLLNLVLYTMPNNNIPNNQGEFANWLYKDNKTCKEDGGSACYFYE